MRVGITGRGRAGAVAAQRLTDRARLSFECVVAFLTAIEHSSVLQELCQCERWQSRGGMMDGAVVVDLVTLSDNVVDMWLEGLLRDDGLQAMSADVHWSS